MPLLQLISTYQNDEFYFYLYTERTETHVTCNIIFKFYIITV
jgi:hypothetical protein